MCHLGRGILRRDGQKGLLSIRSVTIFGGAPFEKKEQMSFVGGVAVSSRTCATYHFNIASNRFNIASDASEAF